MGNDLNQQHFTCLNYGANHKFCLFLYFHHNTFILMLLSAVVLNALYKMPPKKKKKTPQNSPTDLIVYYTYKHTCASLQPYIT